MKNVILLGLILLTLASCSKDESVDYTVVDEEKIQNYLEENNLEATRHPSGLYYQITQQGSGDNAYANARVTVRYTGKLLTGEVFDEGKLTDYPLGGLIDAWKIGIPLLNAGSEAIFYCPSGLAYGSKGSGSIPPNSVLIFEIKLISFQ